MIISIRPSRSSATWDALVGLGRPDALALGAATYTPDCRISSCAIGWDGIRTATVSKPPVVSSGTSGCLSKISVIGPGQNVRARVIAFSLICEATRGRLSISAICTISGLSDGLPLAPYIFLEESGFSASPPRPYTVSVGNATSPPCCKISQASCICGLRRSSIVIVTCFVFISVLLPDLLLPDIATLPSPQPRQPSSDRPAVPVWRPPRPATKIRTPQ